MKVKGLGGRTHQWNLTGHVPLGSEHIGSQYHGRCRDLLTALFGQERRLEEVPLPGSGGLRGDFYLPSRQMMVEVHGEQHYRYVAFFHRTRHGFMQHQQRDKKKREWCDLNAIRYVELPWDESDNQWRDRILNTETY